MKSRIRAVSESEYSATPSGAEETAFGLEDLDDYAEKDDDDESSLPPHLRSPGQTFRVDRGRNKTASIDLTYQDDVPDWDEPTSAASSSSAPFNSQVIAGQTLSRANPCDNTTESVKQIKDDLCMVTAN